jgi:hypothetical protein
MGRAYRMNRRDEMPIQRFAGKASLKGSNYLDSLDINVRVILKLILMKWGGREWTEFSRFRIGLL